jgi:membrane protein DedA with SNARE-associated domain
MGEMLTLLARWVTDIVYSFGYVGVFVLVLLGDLRLPVPTELTLPLAGFLVGQGRLSFVPVLLTATAARLTTSLVLYALGIRVGGERLRRLVKRTERFRVLSVRDVDRASELFERHGGKVVLIGHLVPGVGALISLPAGLNRMPLRWRFLAYTSLGGTLWTGTLIGLGWALGKRWRMVEVYASFVGLAVLAVVVVVVSRRLWRRWRTRS